MDISPPNRLKHLCTIIPGQMQDVYVIIIIVVEETTIGTPKIQTT